MYECTLGGGGGDDPTIDASFDGFDRDHDGIPDVIDNCPDLANANQGDEDADSRGDLCDRCPPIPSLADPDGDGDGVGDACDPNPATPGDKIVLFEGFDGGIPSSWTKVGSWLGVAGSAVFMASANNLGTVVVPLDGTVHQTISTAVTILSLSGNGGGSVGIVDQFAATADGGIQCGSGKASSSFFGLINAANGGVLKSVAYPFDVGSFAIDLRRDKDVYACTATDLMSQTRVQDSPTPAGLGTRIGLRARTASVVYSWLMVVSSP
jgi:hypothetical protein